jgi:hypothetical protein
MWWDTIKQLAPFMDWPARATGAFHQYRVMYHTERHRMKTRCLCFDALANCPALPVFLGKADKNSQLVWPPYSTISVRL